MTQTTAAAAAKVAKLNAVVRAVRDWQAGAVTWGECLRRADLTAGQEARLGRYDGVSRTTPEPRVAAVVAEALGL